MDTVVLSSLLNGALLLVCLGLLLSFCVSCGQSWRQTSIHQFTQDDHPNEIDNPRDIRVRKPIPAVDTNGKNHVPTLDVSNSAISLTPAPSFLRSPGQEPERRPSYTPTEDDDDYVNEDNDYIKVLPPKSSSIQKNRSQHNLDSGNNDYENVEQKPGMGPVPHDDSLPNPKPSEDPTLDEPDEKTALQETGSGDDSDFDLCSSDLYINMLDDETKGLTPGKSQESMESDGNGSTDYVNASPK